MLVTFVKAAECEMMAFSYGNDDPEPRWSGLEINDIQYLATGRGAFVITLELPCHIQVFIVSG